MDEAHELNNTTLLILAALKSLLKRPHNSKKLIVASATLETDVFESYMKGINFEKIELEAPIHSVVEISSEMDDVMANIADRTIEQLRVVFDVSLER